LIHFYERVRMAGQGALALDVMVSNHTDIDWEVFNIWLGGSMEVLSVNRIRTGYEDEGVTNEMVQADLQNNFRLFGMLEPLLHQPTMFSEQLVWQLDTMTQNDLISRYYALDDQVARELLGKKLSGRLRKDLDEISEKTGSTLKSCRRQFDNIKRIFKVIEEVPGRFYSNIKTTFNLPDQLATNYAVILFIGVHRFETTKKKLSFIPFQDMSLVSQAIMNSWTLGMDVDENGDPALDRDYFGLLRELKGVQDREKEHRSVFIQTLSKHADNRLVSDMESFFKSFNRNVINIGSTLHHTKEVKDIFINTWEKVVEPLKQQRFSLKEVEQIVSSYEEILTENQLPLDSELTNNFIRFFSTLKVIITTFYKTIV